MRRNWPREGRQPVRDAGGFGLRPNPTQFRAHKLPREGRNLCDLRRIFADAKILALITLKRNKRPRGQESEPTKIRRRSHKLPREGRNLCARNWVGFGLPRPWRDGGQIRRRNWRPSRGQLRRIRHPHGSDSTSEPTPPKGGSDDPLRGSFARTRINFYTVTKFLYIVYRI